MANDSSRRMTGNCSVEYSLRIQAFSYLYFHVGQAELLALIYLLLRLILFERKDTMRWSWYVLEERLSTHLCKH